MYKSFVYCFCIVVIVVLFSACGGTQSVAPAPSPVVSPTPTPEAFKLIVSDDAKKILDKYFIAIKNNKLIWLKQCRTDSQGRENCNNVSLEGGLQSNKEIVLSADGADTVILKYTEYDGDTGSIRIVKGVWQEPQEPKKQ